jgi:NAD(P)-dependent dehydrogenase (short-subunit alcohol dehydrogenase family)
MSKVMIITGASRGIGAATARMAAVAGYDIAVNYVGNIQAAEGVAAEVRAAGRRAIVHQADVSDEAAVIALFDATESELGPVTALVNNAGMLFTQGRCETFDADRLRRVVEVNVLGAMFCAREAVRRMSTTNGGPGGAIVNVSSAASYLGSPNEFVDYAATKGAMDSMTIGLAKELAQDGVRINAVRPGLIRTEIHASSGDPGRVDRLEENVPMGRGGEAEEVASVIMWLLSESASYVTGDFINVSGGR